MSVLFSALLPGSDFLPSQMLCSCRELQLSVGELRSDFQSVLAWLLLLSAESEQLVTAHAGLKPWGFCHTWVKNTTGSRRKGC